MTTNHALAQSDLSPSLGEARFVIFNSGIKDPCSERLTALRKDHKGNNWKRWELNPTLQALESTANTTALKL